MTMMMTFNNGDELISSAIDMIMGRGVIAAPRGRKVLELSEKPTVLVLKDTRYPFLLSPVRRPNYRFGLAEALWILSGSEDARLIGKFNKQMLKYSDDGNVMWGAYGPRLMGQLGHVISVLKKDPFSRQAVLQTWRPQVSPITNVDDKLLSPAGLSNGARKTPRFVDNSWDTLDTPCTVTWHFQIRDGKLNLNVYMRSNDAWLGLPYDILSFTTVQRVVAAMLKVDPGIYCHIVGNIHLYENNWNAAIEVIKETRCANYLPPLPCFTEFQGASVPKVMETCDRILQVGIMNDQYAGLAPFIDAVNNDRNSSYYGLIDRATRP